MAPRTITPDSTLPFSGVVSRVQAFIDITSEYVDKHFMIPIEVLLLLAPLLVGLLRVLWPPATEMVKGRLSRFSQRVRRDIVSTSVAQYRLAGTLSQDRNALLQNAIFMYLTKHVWDKKPLPASVWRGKCSVFLLIDPFRSRVYESHCSPFFVQSSSSDTDGDLAVTSVSRSNNHLSRLLLIKLPTGDAWVPLGVDGIEISYQQSRTRVEKSQAVKRSVSLRAYGKDAAERIEQFVQKSLSFYINELPNISGNSRHYFELQPFEDGSSLLFKRYGLTDDKNINTVFFPDREKVHKLIDNFLFRQGRFAIEGFPYKLGFLLYGPPGTGKTAFVKALASYTGRHVVSVPLQLLKTNQQLYDIFLTRKYSCVGESGEQKLNMNEVIFYIDGAEATNPLVRSREKKRTVRMRESTTLTAGSSPYVYSDVEVVVPNLEKKVSILDDTKPVGAEASTSTTTLPTMEGFGKSKRSIFSMFESADALDLSGLLNVLDGVVDTPGRIIIMTTNTPEMLDPALVRPGRISYKIFMDYVRFEEMAEMAGLHFGDIEPAPASVTDMMTFLEEKFLVKKEKADAKEEPKPASKFAKAVLSREEEEEEDTKEEALQIPVGAAAALMPLRKLSEGQTERLRSVIAELEKESLQAPHPFNFQIAPAEVEVMCASCETLEEFISALSTLIRGSQAESP